MLLEIIPTPIRSFTLTTSWAACDENALFGLVGCRTLYDPNCWFHLDRAQGLGLRQKNTPLVSATNAS